MTGKIYHQMFLPFTFLWQGATNLLFQFCQLWAIKSSAVKDYILKLNCFLKLSQFSGIFGVGW